MVTLDWPILVVLVSVLVALGAAWMIYTQRRRSQYLRGRFGREYDRTVQEEGDRRKAEKLLKEREQRVEMLHLRSLAPEDQERFLKEWHSIQDRFIDDPKAAVEGVEHPGQDRGEQERDQKLVDHPQEQQRNDERQHHEQDAPQSFGIFVGQVEHVLLVTRRRRA